MDLYLAELGFRLFLPTRLGDGTELSRFRWTYSFGGGNWLHITLMKKGGLYEVQKIESSGELGELVARQFLLEKDFDSIIQFVKGIESNKKIIELKRKYNLQW